MSSLCRKTLLISLITLTLAANLALPTSWRAKHEFLTIPLTEAPSTRTLFPRSQQPMEYDTCGYRDGKSDQPLVCPGHNFCNSENDYNWVACCSDYSSSTGYQPYACNYFMTCFDSTQIRTAPTPSTVTLPASLGGDKFQDIYCSDASSPYCNTVSFTDNSHTIWICGSASGVTLKYALSYDTSSSSINGAESTVTKSTSTIVSTIPVTATASINTESLSTTSQPTGTSASVASDNSDSSSSPPNRTGFVIGGATGGAAALAIGAAIVVFLRNRKKKKDTNTSATKPSFEFIGSNATVALPPVASTSLMSPFPPHTSTSCLSEADGGNAIKSLEAPNVTYEPYRRQQNDSISTFELSSSSPYRSNLSSHVQSQPYNRNPSYMQLSVDEVSASNSRHHMTVPTERRQSRFAELDACHMSMQSGPIPEWDARELP